LKRQHEREDKGNTAAARWFEQLGIALAGSVLKPWDATSGAMVREFKGYKEKAFERGHRDGVFCLALRPDGKMKRVNTTFSVAIIGQRTNQRRR
jgi:hypothetical protein